MSRFHGRPIFIMGNQRSGTRMVASILNQHHNIAITDEGHILPRMFEVVRQADRNPRHGYWPQSRRALIEAALIETSAEYVRDKIIHVRRFGNKTPGLEFMLDEVRHVFPDALFIYCLRDPLKVIHSLDRMPWNRRSVAENWKRFRASVDILENDLMFGAGARASMLVQVDQATTVEAQRHLVEDLMRFVDEPLDPHMPYYASQELWTPANTLKDGKIGTLTEKDTRVVTRDPWYSVFCRRYGYRQWTS